MIPNQPKTTNKTRAIPARVATFVAMLLFLAPGCSRDTYRRWADNDAYSLLNSRQVDERWVLPQRTVEPDSSSRLADMNDADCGPLPPDDPAAECYMRQPYKSRKAITYWDERGQLQSIDNEQWMAHLPYNEDGEVVVTKQLAVDLALLHNRDFQTQVERLHSSALTLSQNRFEYDVNWFGGTNSSFSATGDGAAATRDLGLGNNVGFQKNFASGGQFFTNLVNSFTWNVGGGPNTNFGSGNWLFQFTQPLLRGAFRHVRTESLTQAERSMLYEVRDFARFRRQFYFDIVSLYLNLLNQAQSVRIEEDNLTNLKLNLEEHNVLFDLDLVSPIQVDQVFQRYQSGRLRLLNSQQSLQTALDRFKFQLGLPAKVEISLDESILDPFTLNSAEVEQLQQSVDDLKQELLEYVPPAEAPQEFLDKAYKRLVELSDETKRLKPEIDREFKQWVKKLDEGAPGEEGGEAEKIDFEQQVTIAERIESFFKDLDEQIDDFEKIKQNSLKEIDILVERPNPDGKKDNEAVKSWKKIQALISDPGGLTDRINTLFLTQTQIRLFMIDIEAINLDSDIAIELALANRLDLMNSKAAVVDSFRRVEIAADQLESDLSVTAAADLRTDRTVDNAFRFDGDANQYTVGVEFDGPLNRFSERNGYRNAQLAYQQQRRAYMADEDSIVNSVRLNLRQLKTNRFNFQIARQTLITAARQVEQARFNLRQPNSGDSSLTQDLLQALQTLTDTKNQLISSWIDYETSRISLFVDLELLQLDEQGVWVNEQENFKRFETRGSEGDDVTFQQGSDDTPSESNDDEPSNESIERPSPETSPEETKLDGPADIGRSNRRRGIRAVSFNRQ